MLPSNSLIFEGLWDSPKAYLLSKFIKRRSCLVIRARPQEDHLFENLNYFCKDSALEFPAWETLPSEKITPSPDTIGKRFETLHTLLKRKKPSILLCSFPALLQKLPPPYALKERLFFLKKGSHFPFHKMEQLLTDLGYKRRAVVSDKGEFALRGGIIDLFPVSSTDPFRIDFFGDEIDDIRTFDPVGQKSIGKAEEIFLSPAEEMPLLEKYKEELCTIFDYLDDPIIFFEDLLSIEDAYVSLKSMKGFDSIYFQSFEKTVKQFEKQQAIYCTSFAVKNSFELCNHTFEAENFPHRFIKVDHVFHPEEGLDPNLSYIFLNQTEREEKEVKEKLKGVKLPENTLFKRGYLTSGFCLDQTVLIPNPDITHRHHIRRQKWRNTYHTPAAEFHTLEPGDLVVHFHNGIGRYLGMEKHKVHNQKEEEFFIIQYANESKLFVPLSQAHLISRYIGSKEEVPSLSQIGSKKWQQAKQSAQAQIVGYANELLQLYAKREVHGGFCYPKDSEETLQFEADFPYTPTQDQASAIDAIKADMMSKKPMDRLICGDVGYGKTEVAMRAAFKAVVDGGKQVAVLVPTTVLAVQHFDTFSQRMEGFAVNVGIVSRFSSTKEIKETLQKLKEGQIDIIVGTHRLLSKDVHFQNLGLIIIDEEQRFGVKAKEHLKHLKTGVDCLTLSATPIPRTLYMSLISARDMSVISTPPQDRLPIKTMIVETDLDLIENALLRELARGGQAFFIHNRVETIAEKAHQIKEKIPSLSIGIVHGQMDPEAVDNIFHRFKQNEINLLFATTIIENGIDVPNANTILIDRADQYGLSDLYQLRGRVGRWNRSAYAYFLIPKHARLDETARKRLNALVESSGYGGGMKIAMRDLEIRGAGDILGVQQSGQVSQVGFHLYCKMLKRAIEALKKHLPISFQDTKIECPFEARLPENYIQEVPLRMELYHRLGEASNFEEVDALLQEMIDRFGDAPEPVFWLLCVNKLRIFGSNNYFNLIKFDKLSFSAEQQKGKLISKKTLLLPKKVQNPQALLEYTIAQLQKNF